MSARIAPEPITIAISQNAAVAAPPKSPSRPVESLGASSPDTRRDSSARNDPQNPPQPSSRPPGKDPSIPPQTLLDASLISADFKPTTKFEPAETPAPDAEPSALFAQADNNPGDIAQLFAIDAKKLPDSPDAESASGSDGTISETGENATA